MSLVLSRTPLDLVDFLLDFQRLEVVKLRFMRLEFGIKLIFTALLLWWGINQEPRRTQLGGAVANRLLTD